LVYSSVFEYVTHRVVLHGTSGYLHQAHDRHHETWGKNDEGLYVRFGPPLAVVGLLLANCIPLFVLDAWGAGIGAGALIAFVAYYLAYEELHWRIHLGRLPRWLGWMRKHHFAHHRGEAGRYGVLVPVWDRLLSQFASSRS
jgi:sterol desaturase/sphingolipid hydroxylase (fatty acid hydroxylase superfamily)